MIQVLISLRDPILSDIVSTAFKQFPSVTSHRLPENRVMDTIANSEYDAIVVDLMKGDEMRQGLLVQEIRESGNKIEIIGLVDRNLKDRFNRYKLDNSLFSVFPLPVDPFALAKNIVRLETRLKKTSTRR
ncbi:MAG: hypothetical protein ACI97A_000321 [Planctomycetota bacterium]|jgi:hypothetical protein